MLFVRKKELANKGGKREGEEQESVGNRNLKGMKMRTSSLLHSITPLFINSSVKGGEIHMNQPGSPGLTSVQTSSGKAHPNLDYFFVNEGFFFFLLLFFFSLA